MEMEMLITRTTERQSIRQSARGMRQGNFVFLATMMVAIWNAKKEEGLRKHLGQLRQGSF